MVPYYGKIHPIDSHYTGTFITNSCLGTMKGFTLIELIVVISLVAIMFSFTIPRFHHAGIYPGAQNLSRTMIHTITELKEKSFREQKRYTLHLNISEGIVWVSHEFMTASQVEEASKSGRQIPESLRLLAVEFPLKNQHIRHQADIHFYPEGYSDKAVIYFEKAYNERFALLVEPFLSRVRLVEPDNL